MAEPKTQLKNVIQMLMGIRASMVSRAKVEESQSAKYASLEEYSSAGDRKTRAKVWNEAALLLDNAIKLIEHEE